jgi:hypothetical protein
MRAGFGVLGLVLALAIVGLLAKKQLTATRVPSLRVPAAAGASAMPADAGSTANGLSSRQQSQLLQQIQQSLDKSLNIPRTEPDDSP